MFEMKREWAIPIGTGFGVFVIGTGVGYAIKEIINQKKSKIGTKEQNLDDGKSYFANRDDDSSSEESDTRDVERRFEYDEAKREFTFLIQQADHVIEKFRDAIIQLTEQVKQDHPSNGQLRSVPTLFDDDDDVQAATISIFRQEDDDWDWDLEMANRDPNKPYVIHREEYDTNENDYSQSSLMFYEGDSILCDDKDVPIYDKDKLVGELKFGHGSQDPSICYIRNEKLEAEYEVIVDHGYFQIEVLGQQEDDIKPQNLKHSVHRIPKFRME